MPFIYDGSKRKQLGPRHEFGMSPFLIQTRSQNKKSLSIKIKQDN